MRSAALISFLLCIALAAPSAYAQSCATGLIRVCVTPLLCACVLPGQGNGDPIMRDFSGHKFEFFGEPASFYNLYSDNVHQVNMKLFPGFVDGHNGTYMGDFGFAFHDYRVNVSLLPDGDMTLETWTHSPSDTVNDKHTVLASGEATTMIIGKKDNNALTIATDPFRPYHGRVVDLSTGIVDMSIWSIPPGTKDSKGVEQPAYLNFNLTLLAPPSGDVAEGILGESLHHVLNRQKLKAEKLFADSAPEPEVTDTFNGKGLTNDYRVGSLFGTDFAFNRFGEKPTSSIVARRSLVASVYGSLQYPVASTTVA